MQDMIFITVLLGLRRSELMGLRWDSIDFENNTMIIQHTVVLHDSIIAKKDSTKNKTSNRIYPILPEIKEILLKIKNEQENNKLLFGNCYVDTGYVFTHEDGKPFYPSYVSHSLRKTLEKSDLPIIRWHDLRHSCASILLSKGWGMKDISEWLGHKTISTTMNIYTHIDINRKREVSQGIGSIFHK